MLLLEIFHESEGQKRIQEQIGLLHFAPGDSRPRDWLKQESILLLHPQGLHPVLQDAVPDQSSHHHCHDHAG